jgi:PGF-pre-PGF domain-containing protein
MKKLILILLVFGIALFLAPSIANAVCNGVTICGTNYDCGVADGVCPEDFAGCDSCSTPDPDCPVAPSHPSGGGGGGSSVSGQCSKDIEAYYIDSISPQQFFGTLEDRYCTDLHMFKLTVTKDASSVSSIIKLAHPEVVPPEGKVYNYYTFTLERAPKDLINNVTFRFRVPIDWANSNSVAKNKFVLYKQKRVFWERLDTNFIKEDSFYYYYGATGKSLGLYAIVGQGLTIWDVLDVISEYYTNQTSFDNVLHTIDMYYSF